MSGYSNDDTYAAVIVCDNDESIYDTIRREARFVDFEDEDEVYDLGEVIKRLAREGGWFNGEDIDFDEVNFTEIAQQFE